MIFFNRYEIWGLPYYVRVDGRLVYPRLLKHIDWNEFVKTVGVHTSSNKTYTTITDQHVTDSSLLLSLYLQHKVSTTHYHEVELALEHAWIKQHPGTLKTRILHFANIIILFLAQTMLFNFDII